MADFGSNHTVQRMPGEHIYSAWVRALDTAPPGHCGPIYIR